MTPVWAFMSPLYQCQQTQARACAASSSDTDRKWAENKDSKKKTGDKYIAFTNLHDSQTISCDKLTHFACLLSSWVERRTSCAAVRSSSFATIVHAIINLNFQSVSVWSDRERPQGRRQLDKLMLLLASLSSTSPPPSSFLLSPVCEFVRSDNF